MKAKPLHTKLIISISLLIATMVLCSCGTSKWQEQLIGKTFSGTYYYPYFFTEAEAAKTSKFLSKELVTIEFIDEENVRVEIQENSYNTIIGHGRTGNYSRHTSGKTNYKLKGNRFNWDFIYNSSDGGDIFDSAEDFNIKQDSAGNISFYTRNYNSGTPLTLTENGSSFTSDVVLPNNSNKESYSSDSFTNKYGTPTTKCAHKGCNNYIASSGDTNCCTVHSNKCLDCGKYIDEDAYYCMDCLTKASQQSNHNNDSSGNGSYSGYSSNNSNIGAGGYEMPNEDDESFSDYAKRVDPELYSELFSD